MFILDDRGVYERFAYFSLFTIGTIPPCLSIAYHFNTISNSRQTGWSIRQGQPQGVVPTRQQFIDTLHILENGLQYHYSPLAIDFVDSRLTSIQTSTHSCKSHSSIYLMLCQG